jgi:hypothetical protein
MESNKEDPHAAQPEAPRDARAQECLTDFMDELARSAFRRALERRHAAPAYHTVIESAQLVSTTRQ